MNVYRVFKALKGSVGYLARYRLMTRLQGKIRYTEEDINEMFEYMSQDRRMNPDAEPITLKAMATENMTEKFRLLKKLKGFDFRACTSLLSFHNPRKYAEVNPKSWNSLITNHGFKAVEKSAKSDYNIDEYRAYLDVLAVLSLEYGMSLADFEYTLSKGEFDD